MQEPFGQIKDFQFFAQRRRTETLDKRMLNNLPLAHRLADGRATDEAAGEALLGQAMVGLVDAADTYEEHAGGLRFGAWAEPHIERALDRAPDGAEVARARTRIAQAISSQDRVAELARFLDVPAEALVGGLMQAVREPGLARHSAVRGAA